MLTPNLFGRLRDNLRGSVAAIFSNGGLSFVSAADHGNVDLANSSIANAATVTPTVTIRVKGVSAEAVSGAAVVWWSPFIAMQGCVGKQPTFSLANTGYRYGSFQATQRLLWSYDARTWQAFDNSNSAGNLRTVSNNSPFTQDTVYVSFMPSIRVADRAYYWGQIAAANPSRFRLTPNASSGAVYTVPAGRTGAAGQALPDLSILGAQITDFSSTLPKRTMIALMGTHPSEDAGEREALAFLRAAAADDAFMARWQVLAYYGNPAGQYGGSHRTTFEGSESGGNTALLDNDSNRGWVTSSSPLADIRALKAKILADLSALGVSKPELFVDLHTGPDTQRVWSYVTGASPSARENIFGAAISAYEPDFTLRDGSYASDNGGASFFWASSFAGMYMSFEVGAGWGAASDSAYDPIGQRLLLALKDVTNANLYPLGAQANGILRTSMNGSAGVLDIRIITQPAAARGGWAI